MTTDQLPEPPVPADPWRPIGVILRPVVKRLIVDVAIRGAISRGCAEDLIRRLQLREA